MTELQAQKALVQLQRRQLHGTIVPCGTTFYAVECSTICFTRISHFQRWLRLHPTWREKLDNLTAQLDQLTVSREKELAEL
jgi:hypothetical protein